MLFFLDAQLKNLIPVSQLIAAQDKHFHRIHDPHRTRLNISFEVTSFDKTKNIVLNREYKTVICDMGIITLYFLHAIGLKRDICPQIPTPSLKKKIVKKRKYKTLTWTTCITPIINNSDTEINTDIQFTCTLVIRQEILKRDTLKIHNLAF